MRIVSTTTSSRELPQIVVPPTPIVPTKFQGLTAADEGGGIEPPDPWIAVNSTYVVQAVNSMVRISTRKGAEVQSVPTWALFGIPNGLYPSDVRIIWDAYHARWVGVALAFSPDFSANYLIVLISETSDPLGAWDPYAFADNAGTLPDYPAIASSTDKIVVTANEYINNAQDSDGASILALSWSSILSGTPSAYWTSDNTALFTIRPAQVLSATADIYMIAEATGAGTPAEGSVLYKRFAGAASTNSTSGFSDLTAMVAAFSDPAAGSRQLGGDLPVGAIDGRPTDAIWRSGHLWFVSTFGYLDSNTDAAQEVRLVDLTTQTTGSPTSATPWVIGADGTDYFEGGITMTGNGTLVVAYSRSDSSSYIDSAFRTYAGAWSSEADLDAGDATYTGSRWGDYLGVAADPAGTGSAWVGVESAAGDGSWETTVARIVQDGDSPSQPGVLGQAFMTPSTLIGGVPVKISWGASADLTSGVARYQVAQNYNGGGFDTILTTTGGTTSVVRTLLITASYQYEVRAIDAAGNAGPWRVGSTFTPLLYQQTSSTTYSGTWGTGTSSAYLGSTVKYATAAGASATFSFTGRAVSLVSYKAATRGSAKIYVDGVYKTTISLYRSTSLARQIVYQYSWSTSGSHKLKVVVVGTSGRPRVDIDAWVKLG